MGSVDEEIKTTGVKDVSAPAANPKIEELSPNKTLIAQQYTKDEAADPQIRTDIKTLVELFEAYKPSVDVEFETLSGEPKEETIHFRSLGDFRPKGIAQQSAFLADLQLEMDTLHELLQQLSRNTKFRKLLEDADARAAYIAVLESLQAEL
ncbi:type VI secretion system contractile sheath small subunit [candidate division KSB1 bacterium]|nr:type VI secretion system contractile sheath small subunit [candidate division KSB1 bacterium]